MKFVKNLALALVALAFGICSAFAQQAPVQQFSQKTHQAPPTAVITAEKVDGHARVSWDGIQIAVVEHYIGHGAKGGVVKPIQVGAAKQVMLADIGKNGGRLNLRATDGLYLHIECGDNPNTREPKLVGLRKDCSHRDPVTGNAVGALVVN